METILSILGEIRPEFDFRASDDYLRDGMLDSFDVVTLVAALDRHFCISIDGVQITPENFRNLDAIMVLLRKHGVSL